jgi:methylase of polypeptide subunit release factors
MTSAAPSVPETIDFGGLRISFDDRVLRPRTWTEHQSHWAAELLPDVPPGDVLELCSGAGQIGLLAVAASTRRLVCVDLNPAAAELTLENARAAGMQDRVEMRLGRIDQVLTAGESFPMVIADPPWVRRAETDRFPEDPLVAIDGGDDGLSVARECLAAVAEHLAPGGVALFQLGPGGQAEELAALAADAGLVAGEVRTFGDRGVLLRLDRPG